MISVSVGWRVCPIFTRRVSSTSLSWISVTLLLLPIRVLPLNTATTNWRHTDHRFLMRSTARRLQVKRVHNLFRDLTWATDHILMLLMLHIQRLLVVRILVTLATHHVRCRSLSATEVLSTGRMSLTNGRSRRQVRRWSSDSSHIKFCLTTSSGILGLKIVCSVVLLLGSIASSLGCRWARTNRLLWHLAGIYLSLVGKLSRGSTLSVHSCRVGGAPASVSLG